MTGPVTRPVTRPGWLRLSLGGSALTHAVLGWQLANAPLVRHAPPERDTFDVRMVTLPPPAAPEPLPAPEPPPAAPAPPPKLKAQPEPKATPAKPRAAAPASEQAEPKAPPPEPSTAPPALLAEAGFAAGSIVQRAGAAIGALAIASTASTPSPALTAPATDRQRSAPLAKLSDLSRKPRAPSLDAALRQNYPTEQRRRGTAGQAEVRVVIDRLGRVSEVATVSESATGFAEACRRTLLGSRWSEPLDRAGQAVSTRLTYRCRFEIEK